VSTDPNSSPAETDLATAAHQLLHEQTSEWPALAGGYSSLHHVQMRSIEFDGFEIKLQYNPGRIISSIAKTDPKSLAGRRCFLCASNRPQQQRGIEFGSRYTILCNPFPIFPEHFTVADREHRPQAIDAGARFRDLLDLAAAVGSKYVALYNGPQSGASAPDHMHFQAGSRSFLPLDGEYDRVKWPVRETNSLAIFRSESYLRGFIAFESADRDAIVRAFAALLNDPPGTEHEPMMNIIASYEPSQHWRAVVFPRTRHRPSFYSAEGDERILLSPASVEMGGVCTLPIERDFHRLTREHVVQMYEEVCKRDDATSQQCERIANSI